MAQETQPMSFDDFVDNLQEVFAKVRDRNEPVLVERDGELYRLEKEEPATIWEGYDPLRVERALEAGRGMFAGSDRARYLRAINELREQGPDRFA